MTNLFRPWAEVVLIGKPDIFSNSNMTRISSETFLQQDSTVSTTTVVEQNPEPETETKPETGEPPVQKDSREIKYKTVKEHMKKRSEKYLQKKLRPDSKKTNLGISPAAFLPAEAPVDINQIEIGNLANPYPFSNPELNDILAVPHVIPARTCCPPDVVLNHYENFYPSKSVSDFNLRTTPELLESALAQGLHPSLVEGYARFLTEQQRHASDRSRKQRPKKFRCPHCQVGFSNNGQLKGHIRIHTGERPFKCDAESCGKSFTRNEELTRHRRIHSGLRPFPCPECGKRFGRKDHLKKHIKTHFQQRYQLVPILPSHYPYLYGM